jgi:hypothetical protein
MWKHLYGPKKETPLYITIVSGLPRSGTSMMMRMLEAGGMEVVIDNVRQADADNPYGYYEFEKVKKIKEDASFLEETHGKAFKMVSLLLYELPKAKQYKIIFMKRNIDETLASQKVMLGRGGKGVEEDNIGMKRAFENHIHQITLWLAQQEHTDVMYVNYHDVLEDALASAQAINQFLGNRLDVRKMAAIVDQALYRHRAQ